MTSNTRAGYDRERMKKVRLREETEFRRRIPRSLELAIRAQGSMPNEVPMGWMAGLYRHPYIFVDEGSGAYFRDVDGNRYLDMNQSDLSMNCGYGPPAVVAAGSERLRKAASFCCQLKTR